MGKIEDFSDVEKYPSWPKGLPWKGSRSLIAARGFKSLLLRLGLFEQILGKSLPKMPDFLLKIIERKKLPKKQNFLLTRIGRNATII